ncbi:hypothetical protein CP533_1560 [Ophiocordyceps camponoti-saundersi (nom. inval.)]|nr:hypothetical protein CP533_1560 [Ophiocordyceps camponoti-saundersi (nom. inval.)]
MATASSAASTAPLEKRAVAGSFIFRFPPNGQPPQVALFQRSAHVRTYRHCYAPISGSVEATDGDALTTAWRELAEETGLGPGSLRLLRQGKPYSFVDRSVGREWTINPFAFALRHDRDEAAIKLDDEHDSFAWFDPADVPEDDGEASFRGVPHLLDSLRRVWFELEIRPAAAAAILDHGLRCLRDDRVSGAHQLASVALDTFTRVLSALDRDVDSARWWRSLRVVAWHLWKNGREAMGASILRLLLEALAVIETKLPRDGSARLPDGFVDEVLDALQVIARQRTESGTALQDAFVSWVSQQQASNPETSSPIRIVTLSSSATVASCLARALAQGVALDVNVLESRPLFEGASMARAIATSIRAAGNLPGAGVSVHTDASVALAARGAHILVLGASLIDACGNVSNKTGSLPAVLTARYVAPAVKVVVVAESEKVLPLDPPATSEANDPTQVSQVWADDDRAAAQAGDVGLSNVYFEHVPADLVDCYVSEAGVTTRDDIAASARDARARADRFFSDL